MSFFQEYPFSIPFVAMLAADIVKTIIDLMMGRKRVRYFFRSGGFPSGHSAMVSALVVTMAHLEGLSSSAFTISAVFAIIVMYDAIHLRNEAGKHAEALNKLNSKLNLEESLGHTHLEVVGGASFGAFMAFLLLMI